MVQRDTTELTTENRELKLRLQAMEQQAQLRDGMCGSSSSFIFLLTMARIKMVTRGGGLQH